MLRITLNVKWNKANKPADICLPTTQDEIHNCLAGQQAQTVNTNSHKQG